MNHIYLINIIIGAMIIIGLVLVGIVAIKKKIKLKNKREVKLVKDEIWKWGVLVVQGILTIISCDLVRIVKNQEIISQISPYYSMAYIYSNNVNVNIGYYVDGINSIFILLTIILITSCVLISWKVIDKQTIYGYLITLLIIEILLVNFFVASDIIQFYIIYEAILIPIVFLISIWGSREEKKIAAFQILIYTLIGSIFLLMGILYLYDCLGTTDYFIIKELIKDLPVLDKRILFLLFFLGFAVKLPIVPLHLWLLRAHVEAPTAGSVLLAGILLKLGGYGYIRYNVYLLGECIDYFYPFITITCLISIIYTGIATFTQLDIKKIIAYSSISHMNIVVLGLYSGNIQGIEGAIILMISHGLVSGALFICIGILYERFKTRIVYGYSNVVQIMPKLAIIFFILTLANVAFPLTSSFVGELLLFIGIIKKNINVALISATSMILTAIYSFWLFNRIFFRGNDEKDKKAEDVSIVKAPIIIVDEKGNKENKEIESKQATIIIEGTEQEEQETVKKQYKDITWFEMGALVYLLTWVLILGVFPNMLEEVIRSNVLVIIAK